MEIRRLGRGDIDDLLGLYAHLHRDDTPLPGRETVEAVWGELVGGPRFRVYGGFSRERLVCSCALTIVPNLTRGCRPYGLVENVVTHPRHRGRGHGQAIVAHALDEAWSAGCYKVMLMTGRKDSAIVRRYASIGFDPHDKRGFVARRPG